MSTETRKAQLKIFAVATFLIGIILGASMYSTLNPAWEVGTGTLEIRANGTHVIKGVDDSAGIIQPGGYVQTKQSSIKLQDQPTHWGSGAVIDYDIWDSKYFGSAAIQTIVSNPVHVTKSVFGDDWYQVDDSVAFRTYTKTVNDVTYVYKHHVYTVDVEIRTNAIVGFRQGTAGIGDFWYGTCEGLPSLYGVKPHDIDVRLFFGFVIQPWDIYTGQLLTDADNNTREVVGTWAGVMSASILEIVGMGTVPGQSEIASYSGHVDAKNTVGSAVNMYDFNQWGIDNYLSSSQNTDDEVLGEISNVPTQVVIEVAADLEAGCYVETGVLGLWTAVTPIDKYITYKVRIDVLQNVNTKLISGEQPTISKPTDTESTDDPPGDPFDLWKWFEDLGAMLSTPNMLLIYGAIIAIVVIIGYCYISNLRRGI